MTDRKTECHNRMSKYISSSKFASIRDRLSAGTSAYECCPVTDIIFGGDTDVRGAGAVAEKYIIRCSGKSETEKNVFLIKESSMGNKIKEIIQPVSMETAMRIIQRSTKWLCSSISPLVREMGIKMTTNRLAPETVMDFERESFYMGSKLTITADSAISLREYSNNIQLCAAGATSEPVDGNICLLQINYERVIPEEILSIIGMKTI